MTLSFNVISSLLAPQLLKILDKRTVLFITFLINSVTLLMLGPSKELGFPNKLWLMVLGSVCGNTVGGI